MMLTLTLVVGLVVVSAPEVKAATSGKLVKSVTRYVKKGKKWEKQETTTYTYNDKKDPILIVESGSSRKDKKYYTKIEYTYKNGKKTKRVEYCKYGKGSYDDYEPGIFLYDSKGRFKKGVYENPDGSLVDGEVYTYGKNDYFKKNTSPDEGYIKFRYEWNGKKPKKIIGTWYCDGDKNRTIENTFNKKGLLKTRRLFTQYGGEITYTYNYKNGLIKSVIATEKEGGNVLKQKYKFTYYSKKKIKSSRYCAMINNHLVYPEGVGTFWY